jgi:arylsulfatase A-like enzyme
MRLPGAIPSGTRVDSLTSHLDVLPSLLEACGLPVPSTCEGNSFWSRLTTGSGPARDAIFAQMTYHSGEYDPMRCIRTDRHKFIHNFLPGWPVQISGPYASRFGAEYVTKHFAHARPEFELYDLDADPDEMDNLAGRPEVAETEAALAERLHEFLVDTEDPILEGQIPHIAPELAGCACRWAKFQPRHPEHEDYQFELIVAQDFGEQPLP